MFPLGEWFPKSCFYSIVVGTLYRSQHIEHWGSFCSFRKKKKIFPFHAHGVHATHRSPNKTPPWSIILCCGGSRVRTGWLWGSASHRDNAHPSAIMGGKAATATASAMSLLCWEGLQIKRTFVVPVQKPPGCSLRALPEHVLAGLATSLPPWHSINACEGSGDALSNLNTDVCEQRGAVYQWWHSFAATNSLAGPKRAFSGPWTSLTLTNRKLFPCQQLKWIYKKWFISLQIVTALKYYIYI